MLVSEDKEESGYDELICQPPSVVCVPQQPMQQQAPTYYQPAVQHVYQQHPEMMGLHCSMHQPMPVVPAQFLPPKAETSVCEATYEQEAPKPRGRRNKVGFNWGLRAQHIGYAHPPITTTDGRGACCQ